MPAQIRAAVLTNYASIARAHGLDPLRLVRTVGLSPACLDSPDLRIPIARATALLERSADLSGNEAFGLLMVEGRRISNLGVLGLMAREEPTLRQALMSARRYGRLHNDALVMRLEESGGIASIEEDVLAGDAGYSRQGMEMVVGVLVRMIKVFLGADWRARRICFSHGAPRDLCVHRRVLGQTPEFGCGFNGLVCTSAELDLPIASADPVMAAYLRQNLPLDRLAGVTVADEVRQMIMLLMPRGRCTVEQIAQLMGVHRRTLHRHLLAEGHSYPALLQTIRTELTHRYLPELQRPLREIAQALGFSELSAFSRWHRASFGQTAEQARRSGSPPAPGAAVQTPRGGRTMAASRLKSPRRDPD